MDPNTVQLLIYAGFAVAGWFIRHWNIIAPKSTNTNASGILSNVVSDVNKLLPPQTTQSLAQSISQNSSNLGTLVNDVKTLFPHLFHPSTQPTQPTQPASPVVPVVNTSVAPVTNTPDLSTPQALEKTLMDLQNSLNTVLKAKQSIDSALQQSTTPKT